MKFEGRGRQFLVFVAAGIVLMLAVQVFVMLGAPAPGSPRDVTARIEAPPGAPEPVIDIAAIPLHEPALPDEPSAAQTIGVMNAYGPLVDIAPPPPAKMPVPAEASPPLWQRNAVPSPDVPPGGARIVVIIDDLGVDRKRSQETLALPGPLTAAFLPYAPNLEPFMEQARANGHEIMIHMPMEPSDPALDTGPVVLRKDMDAAAFDGMIDKALGAFDGYVGMNNHMGSRLTQDQAAMDALMTRLRRAGMLFVDSRTIGSSVAAATAARHGVPYAVRDVFLDHDESYEAVKASLAATEAVARRTGLAVAIGHPKDNTIRALAEWLPGLAARGFVLVPVSAVVVMPGAVQTVSQSVETVITESPAVEPAEAVPVAPQEQLPAQSIPAAVAEPVSPEPDTAPTATIETGEEENTAKSVDDAAPPIPADEDAAAAMGGDAGMDATPPIILPGADDWSATLDPAGP